MGEEGRAEDQPPQSHTPVPETSEGEKGSAGPTADQAPQDQAQQSTFAAPFDEDAWFAQEAERLRQLNQNKAQELENLRLAALPAVVCSAQQNSTAAFFLSQAPDVDASVDAFFSKVSSTDSAVVAAS